MKSAERWLLVANCATAGLASSMALMHPNVHLDKLSIEAADGSPLLMPENLATYDRVFLIPPARQRLQGALSPHTEVIVIPPIFFVGYHPDLCYLRNENGFVKGPLTDYHSALCVGAYRAGLSAREAIGLFNGRTYDRLGYLDSWIPARNDFLRHFASNGLNVEADFLRWSRRGPFMYSVNHPRIEVLADVAAALLQKADVTPGTLPFLPIDHLADGPWFPVYPEIAEHLSVPGSYLFKPPGENRQFGLEDFVRQSYAAYEAQELDNFEFWALPSMRQDRLKQFLEGSA